MLLARDIKELSADNGQGNSGITELAFGLSDYMIRKGTKFNDAIRSLIFSFEKDLNNID